MRQQEATEEVQAATNAAEPVRKMEAAGGGAGSVEKEAAGGDGGAASRWSFHPFPASVAMTDAKAVAAHFQALADAENVSYVYTTAQGAEEIVFPTSWDHPDFLKKHFKK